MGVGVGMGGKKLVREGGLFSCVGKQKRLDGAETMDDEYERCKKELGR